MTVCLAMIVRDASATVERCIRSALPLVSSGLFIDTGCTDDTMAVIRTVEADTGLPCTYEQSKWKGHAHNRTELLAHVRKLGEADYALMLDADMELVIEGDLPDLIADEYMIPIRDRGLVYPLPLMTSTKKRFYYAGVAHAYLACEDGPTEGVLLNQLALIDHGGGGGRPGKIEHDAFLLAAEVAKSPDDSRSWFYLAQSYRDLDMHEAAIACYKRRAELGGWDEEVYYALYQAGCLLSEHVSAMQGMKLLLEAWTLRPTRAEALRALSGIATSVADKIPYPSTDLLFVSQGAYKQPATLEAVPDPEPFEMPSLPPMLPKRKPRQLQGKPTLADVTPIIVTRGNVDLTPILETLAEQPFPKVIVWDNSSPERTDLKVVGRYAAITEVTTPLVYWQDDDVIFTDYQALLDEWEPGKVVANMDEPWLDGAGYRGKVMMQGAGSICPYDLPLRIWAWYLQHHAWDEEALIEGDFVFGTLAYPYSKIVDLGYQTRDFADGPDRLYTQPGQTERKWRMIDRCLALLAADQPSIIQEPQRLTA